MRSLSYFVVIALGTYIGYHFIGLAALYFWVGIIENIQTPSPTTAKIIIYLLSTPGWAFMLFLLFRVYICVRQKQIIVPSSYTGLYYKIGIVIAFVSFLAFLGTFVSALGLPAGGMSGAPLAMVIFPAGLISAALMLRFEIPEIWRHLCNAS